VCIGLKPNDDAVDAAMVQMIGFRDSKRVVFTFYVVVEIMT